MADHTTAPDPERFPYTTPAGSDASMFIQWKGTNVCLDFYCECGAHGHADAYGTYYLQCPACGDVYQLGTQVIAKRVEGDVPHVVTLEVGD